MTRNPVAKPKGQPIVYVREASPDELPDELRGTGARLYSLHDEEGNRLALTPDRRVAFALAKRNEMVPVSVH